MNIVITKSNTKFINKHMNVPKNYKDTAEKLTVGKLELLKSGDIIKFKGVPNWDYKHKISSNTYQLYLHTLNFTKSLVKEYVNNKKVEYIKLAKKIINDWIEKNLYQEKKTNYAWYDHTVSSRIQNLLYFQVNAPVDLRIKKELFSSVFEKHIQFLTHHTNYTENNHGIMMDRALLISTPFLENESLKHEHIMIAKNRIEKAILRDYSYENIHLENSPDYHRMVTNWLLAISEILEEVEAPLSSKYKFKLKEAVKYNGIITNYNNEYPMIGDTSHGTSKTKKIDEDFIDYEAGIAILNDAKNYSTLVFNCGFQNLTHKHYDDLSLTLTLKKEQIFVDSGKYNYNKKDPIRQYMISPKAHSTLFVQNQSYSLKYGENIKMLSNYNNGDYRILKAIHEGYQNITLERIIVYLENGVYVIVDQTESSEQNVYVQNFVLDSRVKLSREGKRQYKLLTENNQEYILQEHSKIASGKIFNGSDADAMISKRFNTIEDTTRIEIRKKQKNATFLTTLSPASIDVKNVKIVENNLLIQYNNDESKITLEGKKQRRN